MKQNFKSDEVEDRQEEINPTDRELVKCRCRETIQKATKYWP